MKYTFTCLKPLLLCFLFFPLTVFSQYKNIKIGNTGEMCETTIAINMNSPNKLVAAGTSDKIYYSYDYGNTWSTKYLNGKYGAFGDPCLVPDNEDRFYFFHLSDPDKTGWDSNRVLDRLICNYSKNSKKWKRASFVGLNPPTQQDKEWAVFDEYTGNIFLTYTRFDRYGSENPSDSSKIMFTYSDDRGKTWKPSIRINNIAGDCQDGDLTAKGAMPAIGPGGEVYVTWALDDKLYFDKSIDGGIMWQRNDTKIADQIGGWSQKIPGLGLCNSFPVIACDLSYGEYHGTIYVNWADQRNGENNTDVWLVKSEDGGSTWSQPIKVNNDQTGKHQFLSWMTVDQASGHIYVVFYDRRNYEDNQTDVYLAYSTDGGETFTNTKISETPFVPNENNFYADYINVSAHLGFVRPVWMRSDNGKNSIWTAIVDMF